MTCSLWCGHFGCHRKPAILWFQLGTKLFRFRNSLAQSGSKLGGSTVLLPLQWEAKCLQEASWMSWEGDGLGWTGGAQTYLPEQINMSSRICLVPSHAKRLSALKMTTLKAKTNQFTPSQWLSLSSKLFYIWDVLQTDRQTNKWDWKNLLGGVHTRKH